jgi:A/G-specific adenine glycosylase
MPLALPTDARAAVLTWFDTRGRALSFRASRDPYAILVSEVMAQQTQISRVEEAWSRFLGRFPSVAALAVASPADVVRAWQGMGYDRRALNLHRAARTIVAEHGGRVPRDVETLQRLPGIGPYTARAVASIAFGMPVGAVDTNARRVLGRALAGSVGLPAGALQSAADASVAPARPSDWTHAVMDVGAMFCRPARPRCEECPLRPWCRFAAESQPRRPPEPSAAESHRPRPPRTSAAESQPGRPPQPSPVRALTPFTSTTRWLRGRIVDRLRETPGTAWADLPAAIGDHDAVAIRRAVAALARDGIIEVDPADGRRARLATT